MGCEPQRFPSDAALKDWTPTDAGTALRKWKKKLRTSFGVSEIGAGRQLIARRAPEAADPSKVPLLQTPKKRVNEASPYMQDSHMVTPWSASRSERLAEETESLRPTPNTRQETGQRPARNYDSPEDSSDSDSDSGDFDYLDGDLAEEWARQIRELSKAETKSSTPRLELATHLPLSNIKPYLGLRNKSEKSMQWLRTFVYEMKGTHTPPNEWCMVFELSLQDGALHWYRQLPRKPRLRECGRDAKDHVEHFLDTCNDRGLEERLCHVQVKDIHDLEDMVNDILRRWERKTSRESSGRRPKNQEDSRRHDGRRTEGSRDSYRRDRHDRERRCDDSRPRVTVANALIDLVAALNVDDAARSRSNRPEMRHHGYDRTETSSDDERRHDGSRCSSESSDSDSSPDGEYGHVAAANDNKRRTAAEGTFARSDDRHPRGGNGPFNIARGYGRDNRQHQCGRCAACDGMSHSMHYCYRRCKLCKQVYDAGKCDALNELTNLLKSKVEKKDLTPELQSLESFKLGSPPTETGLVPIGLPQLTEPAIDADYIFAFAGEVNWPEDREITGVKATEIERERGVYLRECGVKEWSSDEPSGRKTEGSTVSMSRVERSPRSLVPRTKLLPGERLGWWSSQRYDKRKRMGALVKGAVNDVRTRILLDTGANVSVNSANYAKRLRLREVPDHGRSLEVRGINPGVLETRRRALVNISLGWERVYEFEMWIMNPSAGVDVVLGTNFVIPAGVRLDLFHGTARLPDKVMVPLIKSLSAADEESYGTQVVGGPTEGLYIPGLQTTLSGHSRSLDPTNEETRPDGNETGHPTWVWLTNVTSKVTNCSKHESVVLCVPIGELPREPGYIRLRSNKYKEWQILAYAENQRELYECWLAEQPPAVERREYPTPRNILTRDTEASGPVKGAQVYCTEDMIQVTDMTSRECGHRDDSLAVRTAANVSDGTAVERTPAEESEHTIPVPESGDRVFEQAHRQSSTHATDDAWRTESPNGVASENTVTRGGFQKIADDVPSPL
ncbi:LOW QUALITY PROTEIN: Hypothetical protein PHPALM_15666 [Phytophthora palmivora]|uniref:Peptidase A2 domain-containing protein n=1 Tax=Phytophthora palmivora TaxID=4796 RepID=A0A2P4XRL3_9STRA|nr:LOW QUALITY PROTEIN: Hypothetical protein PHPALM_15666 [Phytophthora palmivora]